MSLLDSFFRFSLYIQISPDRLTVRNPRTGAQLSEVPELAIASAPQVRVVAVGTEARSRLAEPNVKLINPFAHQRPLVSDFTAGEQKAFIAKQGRPLTDQELLSGRFPTTGPILN